MKHAFDEYGLCFECDRYQQETKMTTQEYIHVSDALQKAAEETDNHWLALKLREIDNEFAHLVDTHHLIDA